MRLDAEIKIDTVRQSCKSAFQAEGRVGRVGVRRTMLRIAPVLDAGETIVRQNGSRNTEDTETDIRYQI